VRFAPYSLVLVVALVGGSKCPPEEKCECEANVFEFEISGENESMVLYDADDRVVEQLVVDLEDCPCADIVTISVLHREGLTLNSPEPGTACGVSYASPDGPEIEIEFDLCFECALDWYGLGPQPTRPIPIVIKPP
jgi:hypothetical protein